MADHAGISNVLLLEHINLNLAPAAFPSARRLFVDVFGLREDTRPAEVLQRASSLLWANAGLQQFHLPVDATGGRALEFGSQRVDGSITLRVAAGALAGALGARLRDASLIPAGEAGAGTADGTLVLPSSAATLGNTYELEVAAADAPRFIGGPDDGCRPHPCVAPPDVAGSVSPPGVLGIAAVTVRVPSGALDALESFWRLVIGARTSRSPTAVTAWVDGAGPRARGAQRLVFEAAAPPLLPYDGWHAAIYLRDFEGAWARAHAGGLLFDNPRFSDRVGTLALARAHQQFRTLRLGASGVLLELEIRSTRHPSCPLPAEPEA